MGTASSAANSLADFIERQREPILRQWEAFAATMLPAAGDMGRLALRDHGPQILDAISLDLRASQSRAAQLAKGEGRAPVVADAPATAAEVHAVLRARHGFNINQLVAEYRALRASVLQLWIDQAPREDGAFSDMIRFNEAIDQAVAESVTHFHAEVETARNLLLGMLGHDMRSPLATVQATAMHLAMVDAGPVVAAAADRLGRSGRSLGLLLDDLVDFSRTRLGLGIKVNRVPADLAAIVTDEVEQLRGAHPTREVLLAMVRDTTGAWDALRVQQVLRNLVSNAMQHGAPERPVRVLLTGHDTDVSIAISNDGPRIAPDAQAQMFAALHRGTDQGDGLGLGLFIVSAIAEAHGGDVSCTSEAEVTTFTVRLPRAAVDSVPGTNA